MYIFQAHWGHNVSKVHDGATPRHAPVQSGAGPKIQWAGAEQEQGVKKNMVERVGRGARAERWAGVTERGVSSERKFRPLPLRSHALARI